MLIVMASQEDTRYLVTIYTDRHHGEGKLYHFPDSATAVAAQDMRLDRLHEHEIGEWSTNRSNTLGQVHVSLAEPGGVLVASETGPGPEVRWSEPYAIVQVVP